MMFFRRTPHPIVAQKAEEAEELKASIIASPIKVKREVERLNKLIRSNGFALKISVGMGSHHD